jgi:hypothetical protein
MPRFTYKLINGHYYLDANGILEISISCHSRFYNMFGSNGEHVKSFCLEKLA